ncbi:MAG: metal-dependent hydrolase [Flavobacteriales bacterium]|nr:metal-dependent hydrolase [Flavobacteriales bacterium]
MEVTYYGHASFSVNYNDGALVFDPFITPNELASSIDISSIKANHILVSHGHEDHIADVEAIAKNNNATVISNFEIVSWFGQKGVEGHPMNFGGTWDFDFGSGKYVQAVHSSVLPDGTYGGNPGGFVVEMEGCTFYYAGDTALTYDMKLIGESYNLDFAFLPIGDNFTMGVDDAVKATDFIYCKKIIGMHYDTFGYIEIDHDQAKEKFTKAGAQLTLMEIGQTIEI